MINDNTPETDDSTERVINAGMSPIIDYCYSLDMRKMEIERNEAREQAEIFRDAVGKALGAVKFTWELDPITEQQP
jgi:predicted transcriptional regulator